MKSSGNNRITATSTSNTSYFVNSQIASDKDVARTEQPPTITKNIEMESQRASPAVTGDEIIEDQKHLLPFNLIQSIQRKSHKRKKNELTSGSISSGGSGRSCKSSSSGLISLGNTSFGFDFDENEDGLGLPSSEEALVDSEQDEADFNEGKTTSEPFNGTNKEKNSSMGNTNPCLLTQNNLATRSNNLSNSHSSSSSPSSQEGTQSGTISSLTSNPSTTSKTSSTLKAKNEETQPPLSSAVHAAAAAAVERMALVTEKHLNNTVGKWNITTKSLPSSNQSSSPSFGRVGKKKTRFVEFSSSIPTNAAAASKAKQSFSKLESNMNNINKLLQEEHDDEDTEDGYDSDVDVTATGQNQTKQSSTTPASSTSQKKSKKKQPKREERNAREKERSFRISKKINELRALLSNGGVIVPKGTKSSVLTEAVNYIKMLESHLHRSEMERQQLAQQVTMVSDGCFGMGAAYTVRQIATQNGVFKSNDPKACPQQQPQQPTPSKTTQKQQPWNMLDIDNMDDHEYRSIFLSCPVGMAIASLGGAFIDCNSLFSKLSQYTKQEICTMTIFNLTNKCDLHNAFARISQMIIPQMTSNNGNSTTSLSANVNALPNNNNSSKKNNTNENDDSLSSPIILRGLMKHRDDLGLSVSLIKNSEGTAKCFCVTLMKNTTSNNSSKSLPAMIMDCQQRQNIKQDKKENVSSFPSEHAYTAG